MLKKLIRKTGSVLFPRHTKRRALLKRIAKFTGFISNGPPDIDYYEWYTAIDGRAPESHRLSSKPLLSIVVPAYNTPQKYLYPFVYSVIAQRYNNWELVIVNASTNSVSRALIDDCSLIDDRIKIVEVKKNLGISGNTNLGIDAANGEYICFMDHDDTLHPDALLEVVREINKNGKVDLIYTDEDKLTEDGEWRHNPHFKPDWSPRLMESVNYITHFVCVKASIAKELKLIPELDGSQDYDFLLRLTDRYEHIVHIPRILYHWREAIGSTAQSIGTKPKAGIAGIKALKAHYERIGLSADVDEVGQIKNSPGFYFTKFKTPEHFNVFIDREVHDSLTNDELKFWESIREDKNVHVIFSQSSDDINNVKGLTIRISDYFIPKSKNDLYELAATARAQDGTIVVPQLFGNDGRMFETTFIKTENGLKDAFNGYSFGSNTYFGNTLWSREASYSRNAVIACSDTSALKNTERIVHTKTPSLKWTRSKFKFMQQPRISLKVHVTDSFGNPNLSDKHAIQGLRRGK